MAVAALHLFVRYSSNDVLVLHEWTKNKFVGERERQENRGKERNSEKEGKRKRD